MQKTISKITLYPIITGVFIACLLISNILASKTFMFGEIILPCAVIIFPLVYIVNDVMAEIYGFKRTRNIILLGFIMNAVAVLAYQIAILLPAPEFNSLAGEAFAITLGSTGRILIASFAAYLVGSFINAYVMVRLKEKYPNFLLFRCMGSTIVGEGLDAVIFISIAFFGTMAGADLLTMIIGQATFKIVFEFVCYPLTRTVIKWVNTLPTSNNKDVEI